MRVLALVLFGIASASALPAPAPWYQGLDFAAVEARLATGRILGLRSLEDFLREEKGIEWHGSNPLFVVELAGGLRAVFRWEDELWGSQAEVAGYRFTRRLGTPLTPPTVPRTLLRRDLAPGVAWPWEVETRAGSLQLYVDAAPGKEEGGAPLPEKVRADIEVVTFLVGNFDNHGGNLLRDRAGAPVLIDYENALDVQYQRYGDFTFAKRGGLYRDPSRPRRGRPDPFPFDAPDVLVDPSLEEIEATFGPWWGQYWAGGMKALHRMLRHIPGRRVPFVVYDDQLWVQVRVASRHPAHTDVYSQETLERIRALTREELATDILLPPFDERHVRALWLRRGQLLEAAERGMIIP